jgi:arsenate reductase (thioredoxin)
MTDASLPRVLFVCVENSNRSQMAEAFARMHGAGVVDPHSAGSRPSGTVNPRAIEAMKERGYDLTRHRSKSLQDVPQDPYAAVVTMGCGDACPWIPAARREDWDLPDPKNMSPDEFRSVRDDIERRVLALLADIREGRTIPSAGV